MHSTDLNPGWLALAVRQPWAELIVRGIKSIEIRTVGVAVRGRIYIYASKQTSNLAEARAAIRAHQLDLAKLPLGLVVGTVELRDARAASAADAQRACVPAGFVSGRYAWELANPVRFARPVHARFQPYGIWFYPFRARPPCSRSGTNP